MDYKVAENAVLTTVEVGDAYLSTVQGVEDDDAIQSLTFDEFLQVGVGGGGGGGGCSSGNRRMRRRRRRSGSSNGNGGYRNLCRTNTYSTSSSILPTSPTPPPPPSPTPSSLLPSYQVLVRLAVRAHSSTPTTITTLDRLKGFFLLLWRNMTRPERVDAFLNSNSNSSRHNLDSVKSKGGDLNICGSALFNMMVVEMWREDGYRDYLEEKGVREEGGKEVLGRIAREKEMIYRPMGMQVREE